MTFAPKRALFITTGAVVALLLTACGNDGNTASTATSNTPTSSQNPTQDPTGALGEFSAAIRELDDALHPLCDGITPENSAAALAPSRALFDAFRAGLNQTPFAAPFDDAVAQAQANRPIPDCPPPPTSFTPAELRAAETARTEQTRAAIAAIQARMETARDQAMAAAESDE